VTLAGKVVLVTGAARGMGRAYVRGFLERGARVVATDRSWAPSGVSGDSEDFLSELAGRDDVLPETMDVSIDSHVERVYTAAIRRFGTIDVILNNAGLRQRDLYPPHGSVTTLETEVGDWQAMFNTHVFGTFRVIKTFVQPMLARGSGSIICVASDGYNGWRPQSREMPYQAAKAGMVTMALYLAHELRESGIAVNVLLPGHTRSTGSDEQEAERAAMRARMGQPAVAPRRLRPEHVVPLALHLADAAPGETGQVLKATEWNEANGLPLDEWVYEGDMATAPRSRP
jgi:NAD(P)-dependent dehydrogenase (short-subunit alcohol dehydrogenase family)